jgi:ketosteroid isomerase-like protein
MPDLPAFTIDRVISCGNSAVAYGGMTMKEETGDAHFYGYCDIYAFDRDEKITELRSFIVEIKAVE